MLLKNLYSPEVAWCGRDTTVLQAARLMRQKHVGDLVIVDDPNEERTPVGLVTDRDIVVKALGAERDLNGTRVSDIMGKPLVTAHETEDTSQAISRMREHGVRRLPVVNAAGKLVGIVTLDDLLKLIAADANSLHELVAKEQDREARTCR